MAVHPTRFMIFLGVLVLVLWILTVLNPLVIWSVDPILIVGPMVIVFFVLTYYFYSEGHRWAYSLVSHQSHSSTAEGKPAFIIPSTAVIIDDYRKIIYPEMVGFAKGGSRLYNVYGFGGKKEGFLIVPRHQVINIKGHRMVNTITRDIPHTALPPHIRDVLERDRRFDPRAMVEFGTVPYIRDLHANHFARLEAPDMDLQLDQAHQQNHNLRENIKALQKDITALTGIIGELGEGLRRVPSETLQDHVKRAMKGEDDD